MTSITRLARAEDLPALKDLTRSSGLFSSDELKAFDGMMDDSFASIDGPEDWLVLGDREVHGAALHGPEPMTPGVWTLWFIAVRADRRREGVAFALLKAVEYVACKAGARLLSVDTSDAPAMAPARALYPAAGFEEEGRFRDWYAEGEARISFRKRL